MQTMIAATPDQLSGRSLCDSRPGDLCRVDGVHLDAELSARLAGLGVSVGRHMRVVRSSEPLVVQVYGSRIGIARVLAGQIRVSSEASFAAPVAELR